MCPLLGSDRAIILACGINPWYGDLDPYAMGASVVDEAVRNAVACGADVSRLALLDNFCWGSPDRPEELGALVLAAKGAADAALAYRTPFISGKDSLNNEFRAGDRVVSIPGTLLISAIGVIDDWRRAKSMDLKAPGNLLYMLGITKDELGGSRFLALYGELGEKAPGLDLELAPRVAATVSRLAGLGLVRSCHDLSDGGLAVAAAEMAIAGGLGMELELGRLMCDGAYPDVVRLFSESNARYLVEVEPAREKDFLREAAGVPVRLVGCVKDSHRFRVLGSDGRVIVDAAVEDLARQWRTGLKLG